MGMTKRWMESEAEKKRAEEKRTCGCYFNWDDKFEVLCDAHRAEAEERECENEKWLD